MLKILSWNILHPEYALRERYPHSKCLEWTVRRSLITHEIRKHSPDVVFLQEVDVLRIEEWESEFTDYHLIVQLGKKMSKALHKWRACDDKTAKAPHSMVCLTMLRKDCWSDVTSIHIGSRTLELMSKHCSGKQVRLVNVHLEIASTKDCAKLHQKHLSKVLAEYGPTLDDEKSEVPLILGGDFNSTPDSPTIEYMLSSRLAPVVYKKQWTFSDYKFKKLQQIDYLWVSSSIKTGHMQTLDIEPAIPSLECPSDHRPIWVELEIQ